MTTWLVSFKERTFLTKTKGGYIETSLVRETIKSEMDSDFFPNKEGIERFKNFHEGVEGNYSVEIEVLSWSGLEEDYDED